MNVGGTFRESDWALRLELKERSHVDDYHQEAGYRYCSTELH